MCMAMPELETECADIEDQIRAVAARLQRAEGEIEAVRADADSGVTRPGGHGALIQQLAALSERRDALARELERLHQQQARQRLDELAQAAPERTVELEKLAGELGAKAGDMERVIASAEKQLTHWELELAKGLKSDNKDGIARAQSELNLHQARATNARATLESIEGERQQIESEILRYKAAQGIETALLEHATHAASLSAHHAAGAVADRLFRIGVSAGRDAQADVRNELSNHAARIRALGQQAGLDSALLLESGMGAGPSAATVAEVLLEHYGIVESPATAKIFAAL